tara:strand:- start:1491 stop:2051 length:561 start_codon:yes stop_codon:yes gene_type:complete
MKKTSILFLFLSIIFANFESGLKMFGGTAQYYQDLENDEVELYIAPKFGVFLSDNFLIEGGLSYRKWEYFDYDLNKTRDDNEMVVGLGIKIFLNKLYLGLEHVSGVTYMLTTPVGTAAATPLGHSYVFDLAEADAEMLIWKIGIMSPVAENIFVDMGLHFQEFIDDDFDHDGFANFSIGLSYFWKD